MCTTHLNTPLGDLELFKLMGNEKITSENKLKYSQNTESSKVATMLFISLAILMFMIAFERTVALIFVLNFAAGALNASVILFLATMTGMYYIFAFNRIWPHTRTHLSISTSFGFLMIILSIFNNPLVSLLAVVVFQIVITPVIIHYLQVLQKEFTIAIVMGVVFQIMVRSLLDTASFYATNIGATVLLSLNVIWLIIWLMLVRMDFESINSSIQLTRFYSVFSFLIIEIIFLGSPSMMSTWLLRNYLLTTISSLIGLYVGLYITFSQYDFKIYNQKITWYFASILFLISMTIIIWSFNEQLSYLAIFLAQIFAVYLLSVGISPGKTTQISTLGKRLTGIQFVIILVTFLVIGAPFWTAMPLKFLLKHNDKALMLAVSSLLPLSNSQRLFREEIK